MQFNLVVLPGDGVGPEVAAEGVKVLQSIGKRFGHFFESRIEAVGGLVLIGLGVKIVLQHGIV